MLFMDIWTQEPEKRAEVEKKVLLAANDYWTDIAKCESVPVMDAEEVSKLMSKAQSEFTKRAWQF